MDLTIEHDSAVAPFEQLRSQIAGRVARGELGPGSRLPTVRALAADLGLAVNTVARAYRELEQDGVVITRGRKGTFVASALVDGTSDAPAALRHAATGFTREARRAGLTRAEAHRLLDDSWD